VSLVLNDKGSGTEEGGGLRRRGGGHQLGRGKLFNFHRTGRGGGPIGGQSRSLSVFLQEKPAILRRGGNGGKGNVRGHGQI